MINSLEFFAGEIASNASRIKSLAAAANALLSGRPGDPVVIENILIDILDIIEMLGSKSSEYANNIEAATRQAGTVE